jgi:hypothetical protein
MLRSCPNRLEFKNECYSTVNQLRKKPVIFSYAMVASTGARSYIFTSSGIKKKKGGHFLGDQK